MKKLFLFCFAPVVFSPTLPAAEPVTLDACFQWAKSQSEALQIQGKNPGVVHAQYKETLGSVLPHVNFLYSANWQDTSGLLDSGGGFFGGKQWRESSLHLRQPIFSGFREFHAMSALKSMGRREKILYDRAARLLYLDVARAFYTTVLLENDLRDLREIIKLTEDRARELKDRIRLGKSRESELLSVESQVESTRAEADKTAGDIAASREMLLFLTGKDISETPLADGLPLVESAGPRDIYVQRASSRMDVAAQKEYVESRRQTLKVHKGSFWPSVDLNGNYYLKRVGFSKPIDWDLVLGLDLPVFSGGSSAAQTRRARLQLEQAELELSRVSRNAVTEIKTAHAVLETSVAQTKSRRAALEKAEASYKLQVKEYRLGLVNNLEVLQALNAMTDARRDFDRAVVQAKLDLLQLKVAAEEAP